MGVPKRSTSNWFALLRVHLSYAPVRANRAEWVEPPMLRRDQQPLVSDATRKHH
eukprot:COSAG02_NODE_341_length_24173_cov_28.504777_28_plen_54_part_00